VDLEIVAGEGAAGRVAIAFCRVCTTLHVWVSCNLRLLYDNTLYDVSDHISYYRGTIVKLKHLK